MSESYPASCEADAIYQRSRLRRLGSKCLETTTTVVTAGVLLGGIYWGAASCSSGDESEKLVTRMDGETSGEPNEATQFIVDLVSFND